MNTWGQDLDLKLELIAGLAVYKLGIIKKTYTKHWGNHANKNELSFGEDEK
jgi:hypothetical protein